MVSQSKKRSSVSAGDALECSEDDRRRTLTLRELRPYTLIGNSRPLYPWDKARVTDFSNIRNKETRAFYEHQNEVIDSLEFVDHLLDTGIHASLLEEYGDDIGDPTPRQRSRQPKTLGGGGSQNQHRTNVSTGGSIGDASAFNSAANSAHESNRSSHSPPPQLSPSDIEAAVSEHTPLLDTGKQLDEQSKMVQFWIHLNLVANILLLIGKLAVFFMTDSLSIVASLVDSVLDLLSTLIIYVSSSFADRRDWKTKQLYPVGRYRLEPIGVLVFSVIMVVSFVKIAQEAIESLYTSWDKLKPVYLGVPSLIVMFVTIGVKFALWLWCRRVPSSSVQALSQDAMTDCVFNTFSILFPLLSQLTGWGVLDPLGALFLALYVVNSWGQTAMEHINNLTGAASSPEERQQLLYLCSRFSERIKYINVLHAYHAGDRLMCEVDVLLDPELSMRDAHDIAEALQYALETLPIVERAFVHIDYRRDNFSGHVV